MKDLSFAAELLSKLVGIQSISGAEDEVVAYVYDLFTELGLSPERFGNSLVVRVGTGAPRLLLNSHLDTVPFGEGWHDDPLNSTWKDGRLVARGANDAKASAAAMIWATLQLANEDLEGQLILALTACEETNNSGMTRVIEEIGLPDLAITGEPTGLEVVRSQSGLAILTAEWTGKSCHAAHVSRVEHSNALHAAATDIATIPSWIGLPEEHPLLGASTIAPTVLNSGTRHNVVPDVATLTFDGRLAPPYTGEDCRQLLSKMLPNANISIRSDRLRAMETAASHPLVLAALEASGKEGAIGSATMSDMALLQGVPSIKCGPGETSRSHTPNEWVTLDELNAGCEFYRAVVPAALAGTLAESLS